VTEADIAIDRVLRTDLRPRGPTTAGCRRKPRMTRSGFGAAQSLSSIRSTAPAPSSRVETSFAHSLAVVDGGDVTAGVVYLPIEDKLYAAAKGKGRHAQRRADFGFPTTDVSEAQRARHAAECPAQSLEGRRAAARRNHRPSIAYRLALVAEGRFDADADVSRNVGMGHRRGRS
jgi:myo-inositol-1(or 4)-monophosphatase